MYNYFKCQILGSTYFNFSEAVTLDVFSGVRKEKNIKTLNKSIK